jgi:hypothetical protein
MTIRANILALKQEIIDQGPNSPTADRLKGKAIAAILGGTNEWVAYMKEFAKTPAELARLIPTDGSEADMAKNNARAYLIANAPCGVITVTGLDQNVTDILDIPQV